MKLNTTAIMNIHRVILKHKCMDFKYFNELRIFLTLQTSVKDIMK